VADVTVHIEGDDSGLEKTLENSGKKVDRFGKKADGLSKKVEKAGKKTKGATLELSRMGGKLAAGLGLSAATAGFKIFGAVVEQQMREARRQAELTQKAFEDAFSAALSVNIDTAGFQINNRDQVVALGQAAQQELNRINQELRDKFGGLIDSDIFEGSLEKALQAASLVGIGEEQLVILRDLQRQRKELQTQVDFYTSIEQKLTNISRLNRQNEGRGLFKDPSGKNSVAVGPPKGQSVSGLDDFFNNEARQKEFDRATSSFGELPELPEQEIDSFDQFILDMGKVSKLAQHDIIPAYEAMSQQSALLEGQLTEMIGSGVDPSSEAFLALKDKLFNVREEMQKMESATVLTSKAFGLVKSIGETALSGLAFKFEEANSAAAKFRNTLRQIGNQLIDFGVSTLLDTGLSLGIGALTGNPISFGAALGSALGIEGLSFGSKKGGGASLPTPSIQAIQQPRTPILDLGNAFTPPSQAAPQKVQLEATSIGISGEELLVLIKQAESTSVRRRGF